MYVGKKNEKIKTRKNNEFMFIVQVSMPYGSVYTTI